MHRYACMRANTHIHMHTTKAGVRKHALCSRGTSHITTSAYEKQTQSCTSFVLALLGKVHGLTQPQQLQHTFLQAGNRAIGKVLNEPVKVQPPPGHLSQAEAEVTSLTLASALHLKHMTVCASKFTPMQTVYSKDLICISPSHTSQLSKAVPLLPSTHESRAV